ncbi:GNAT family N-acetyltransferase [Hydrogenophaga sp.]|uniref:GNAT family N-acetyltransferase n=1 Tax=Hydrogenophaga sp. TaxID=1904254 RepID=UPI0027305F18|nr:GNAT family N-acetyltransferase [Hydrogenophaga sp.]MDP2073786.1 GNAT family N-acetyltransferase [Hydrogenophaga sp.]MDP3106910.1 GNAT family N-acetyltransferase [Hydrogenophaga sp.]MDZ4397930.1 GNAT family N-acetyltransferase [Hydrogenophaga sp.]
MTLADLRAEGRAFDRLSAAELAAWDALHAAQGPERWAFLSVGFSAAVHETLAPVRVVLLWDGDALAGVLPLQRQPGRLGRLGIHEPVGGVMADYAGLVGTPGLHTTWPALLGGGAIPCLFFTHLDEQQRAHGLGGGQPSVGLRTRIHAEGGAAHWAWLRTQDKKLVDDTERRERKLQRDHGAVSFAMEALAPEQNLQILIESKNAQYRRTGASGGPLLEPQNQRLLAHLLAHPSEGCRARLSVLTAGERWVSGHFGLQSGSTLHYWFPVYGEAFAAYSPGRILFKHVILQADATGIRLIDRGQGDTAAKRDFATETHQFFKGLEARGLRGQMLAAAQRLAWRFAR